jgi:hypothetical protein
MTFTAFVSKFRVSGFLLRRFYAMRLRRRQTKLEFYKMMTTKKKMTTKDARLWEETKT